MIGTGTAINVVAVLVGGGVGTIVGAKLPEGIRRTAIQASGIVTLLVGVSNFLEHDNPLVPLVSVILGLLVGELCRFSRRPRAARRPSGEAVFEGGEPGEPGLRYDEPALLRRAAHGRRVARRRPEGRLRPARALERAGLHRRPCVRFGFGRGGLALGGDGAGGAGFAHLGAGSSGRHAPDMSSPGIARNTCK